MESGDSLLNVYSVIAVSPERFPRRQLGHGRQAYTVSHVGGGAGPDRGPRRKRVWEGGCLLPHEDKNLNERPSTSPVAPVQACHVLDMGTGVHSPASYPCRVQLGRPLTSWTWCWTASFTALKLIFTGDREVFRHSGQDAPDRWDFHADCDPRIHSRRKPDLLPRLPPARER